MAVHDSGLALRRRDRARAWLKRKSGRSKLSKKRGCPQLHQSMRVKSSVNFLDLEVKNTSIHPATDGSELIDRDLSFVTCMSEEPHEYDIWSYVYELGVNGVIRIFSKFGFGSNHLSQGNLLYGSASKVLLEHSNFVPSPSVFDSPSAERYVLPMSSLAGVDWNYVNEKVLTDIGKWPCLNLETADVQQMSLGMTGHWITDRARSDKIEAQFKFIGIPWVKRSVLSNIAIPVTIFCEDHRGGKFHGLHLWLHTPIGLRHIKWNLDERITCDEDPDAGSWQGTMRLVDVDLPGGQTVKALQRRNQRPGDPSAGMTIETRIVLPDPEHRKVLIMHFDTYPKGLTHNDFTTGALHITRVCKFVHRVDNVVELSRARNSEEESLKNCVPVQNCVEDA